MAVKVGHKHSVRILVFMLYQLRNRKRVMNRPCMLMSAGCIFVRAWAIALTELRKTAVLFLFMWQ